MPISMIHQTKFLVNNAGYKLRSIRTNLISLILYFQPK